MMKKKIFILVILLAFCLYPPSAGASSWLECKNLNKDSSYEGKESLKYLVPGQENWLFISKKDFMEDFTLRDETIYAFQKFQKALKEKRTDLVLVVVPQRGLVHTDKIDFSSPLAEKYNAAQARQNYKNMISQLQTAGISITESPDFKNIKKYAYARDHHWNSVGAKLIASLTAKAIKTLPSYSSIEKKKFKIEEGKIISFKGSFFNPIKKICNTKLPIEHIKEQISTSSDEDLFSNSKKEIVLVGTSFSEQGKSFANFAGHLRVALSANIDNRSIGGGGVSTSLLEYLKSENFKNEPAKILIWEIPGFYSLNRKSLLDKAIRILEKEQ